MDRFLEWAWGLFDRWDVGPSDPLTLGAPGWELGPGDTFRPGDIIEFWPTAGQPQRMVVSWREGAVLYVRPARR